MKSKKNRKCIREPSPAVGAHMAASAESAKFKFNLSEDNISCFMGKNKVSKRICRKTSQSSAKNQRPQSKCKSSVMRKGSISEKTNDTNEKPKCTDMIVELSNTIISKIEEKGIMCTWNDN